MTEQFEDWGKIEWKSLGVVVILSGGMDSATALGQMVDEYGPDCVHALSFDYGQRHKKELDAARALAVHYNIAKHRVIKLPREVLEGFHSPLVEADVPVESQTYREMITSTGMAQTVVPNRNMIMLSLATAYAMSNKLSEVWFGAHAEDARNWAYSDCTPEFSGALSAAIFISSYGKVRLVTPFQLMTKGEVAKRGLALKVPYELTISCYEGTRPACGKCPTCQERLAAFEYAGAKDPIQYAEGTVLVG